MRHANVLLAIFLAGCTTIPSEPTTVTVTETVTDSPAAPAFPTLKIVDLSRVYYEEGDYTFFIVLKHYGGPCIDTTKFLWQSVESGGTYIVQDVYDGGSPSDDAVAFAEWCVNDDAAIDFGDFVQEAIRAIDKTTGVEVWRGLVPGENGEPSSYTATTSVAGQESAAATSRSPSTGILEVTLVKEGFNAPYQFLDSSQSNFARMTVGGTLCRFGDDPSTPASEAADVGTLAPTRFAAGSVVRLDGRTAASGCVSQVQAGSTVAVELSLAGTVILTSNVRIQ